MFEDCAIHQHVLSEVSKLDAASLMSKSFYVYQSVTHSLYTSSNGKPFRFCGEMVDGRLNRLNVAVEHPNRDQGSTGREI
jgi:hypothetical protein